jgi:hypothetical protein
MLISGSICRRHNVSRIRDDNTSEGVTFLVVSMVFLQNALLVPSFNQINDGIFTTRALW